MFFLDQHEKSLAPKCLFLGAFSGAMIIIWWMMFPFTDAVPGWFEPYILNGDPNRRGLVLFCLVAYFLRLTVTTLVFLTRKFIWVEALFVTLLMTFVLLVFARVGGSNPQPLGLFEITGTGLYLGGSFLNTYAEYQRQHFKSDPANKGHLYTQGLFKFSRNINYFGDVVLFSGLSLVTGRVIMLFIPLFMTLNFIFIIIPRKEAYLATKYGAQFGDYTNQTRKFIPYIY